MWKGIVGLVTGGSSGLGLATAKQLTSQNARVVICDLPSSNGADVVKSLKNTSFVPADVTSEEDVKNLIKTISDTCGRLDVLVNCAGTGSQPARIYNFKYDKPFDMQIFEKTLQVNLFGTFNVIRFACGLMGKNEPNENGQRGVIVNTSSVAAFDGQIGQVAYSASKAGIVGMTLPLSRDLAKVGIRVMTIAPGLFKTPMLQELSKPVIKELEASVPFPARLGYPEEFASLVQTVIENPMLNGETIRIDGAIRLKP